MKKTRSAPDHVYDPSVDERISSGPSPELQSLGHRIRMLRDHAGFIAREATMILRDLGIEDAPSMAALSQMAGMSKGIDSFDAEPSSAPAAGARTTRVNGSTDPIDVIAARARSSSAGRSRGANVRTGKPTGR